MWFLGQVFQVGEGGFFDQIMYLETVDTAIS
jgi:hypothetical protein